VRRHIPALDGLRAIAVLMVLATHFWADPAGYPLLNRLAAFGWAGVDLFFVLSGFLITGILWNSRDKPHYFLNFYARRTLRIFPLYYAVLGLVLLVLPLVATLPARVISDRALYFLYLSNFALAAGGWQLFLLDITWSLSIEEQFYLVWPSVVRVLTHRRLMVLCVALIILVPLARLLSWNVLGWRWLHMMTPLRMDAFAVGALLALKSVSPRRAASFLLASGTLILGLVLSGVYARDSWLVGTVGYSLNALAAGAAVGLATSIPLLTARPLRHIGKVSYGMYLLHPLCLAAASTGAHALGFDLMSISGWPLIDAIGALAILTLFTVAVSTVSFAVLETRFLRLKRHFASESDEGSPLVASAGLA